MKINLIHYAVETENKYTENIIKQVINNFENGITSMLVVKDKQEAYEQMNKIISHFLNKNSEILFYMETMVIHNTKAFIFIEYPEHMANIIKEDLYNSEICENLIEKKGAKYYKKIKNIYINDLENMCILNEINRCLKYFCGDLENKNEYVHFTFGTKNGLKSFHILEELLKQDNVILEEKIPEKPSITYEEYMSFSIDYNLFYKIEVEGKLLENINKRIQEFEEIKEKIKKGD